MSQLYLVPFSLNENKVLTCLGLYMLSLAAQAVKAKELNSSFSLPSRKTSEKIKYFN